MTVNLHDARGIIGSLPVRVERKFYLPPEKVEMAYGLLRTLARPDGDFFVEEINSLYFDTFELDEYERALSGDYRKNKVRIRWYGASVLGQGKVPVFLELKSRQGFASTKQRLKLELPADNLLPRRLAEGILPAVRLTEALAGFGYFPAKTLLPVIKISYLRFRFRDVLNTQSLALDCHIRSTPFRMNLGHGERELELSGAVLEIKGPGLELPVFLQRLSLLGVDWGQYSKYSACISSHRETPGAACRLSPSGRNITEAPVFLREPGSRQPDWNRLFPFPVDSQVKSQSHDVDE
jgi:hypothetical protein